MKSIIDHAASREFRILCSLDLDDPSLPEYLRVVDALGEPNMRVCLGSSVSKIDAINRDVQEHEEPWDVIIVMSDDMVFTQQGFDDLIRRAFSNGLDQFVHFNDGNQGSNLCTMSIMGRDYYQRFNYVYHPSYISLWCDVEAQEVAKALGRYVYMGDEVRILKHLHPDFGLAPNDNRYETTNNFVLASLDEEMFRLRKAADFPSTKEAIAN